VSVDGSLALLSGHTGYDFSKRDLDTYVEDIKDLPGIQGLFEVFTKMHHEKVSLRTAAALYPRLVRRGRGPGGARAPAARRFPERVYGYHASRSLPADGVNARPGRWR
jgi:hypothetical protein